MSVPNYSNGGSYCFASSVANSLARMGDVAEADRFIHNWRNHHLVLSNGIVADRLTTRVISDITEGRYQGTFRGNFALYLDDTMQQLYGDRVEEVMGVMMEEMRAGRVRQGFDIPDNMPFLYGIGKNHSKIGHWIVHLGGGRYIDDGNEVQIPLNEIILEATLELKRI